MKHSLPRSTPEAQGIPSSAIAKLLDRLAEQEMHSFMLVRNGHVVAERWWEPYTAERHHILFSLSKSFTSTAIGLAQAEGLLSVGDHVLDFFTEFAPAHPSDNLRAMRIHDLLTMSCGQTSEPNRMLAEEHNMDWRRAFLEHEVPHAPGTHFFYNSIATYMCSAILQKVTGERLLDYLTPRLFEPLGIEHPTWDQDPAGIDVGGWGLSVRTEDIAKFGWLYQSDGVWDGRQLLPEGWCAEATRFHVENAAERGGDWTQGYGYQFWRCQHGAYRGDGAFGQYCVVHPEQGWVVAITSSIHDMQAVLTALWEELLPAVDSPSGVPVALSTKGEVARPVHTHEPPLMASGTYIVEGDPEWTSLDIRFGLDADTVVLSGNSTLRLVAGRGGWRLTEKGGQELASSGGWTGPERYELRWRATGGTYGEDWQFQFGDELVIQRKARGTFGPSDYGDLRCRRTD